MEILLRCIQNCILVNLCTNLYTSLKKLKGEINVRLLIALVLAVPLYNMVGFGWGILLIAGLQLLAGLDLELWKRSR